MKVIKTPFECGYCNIQENYRDDKCKHPKNANGQCPEHMDGDEFPIDCPLQEGQPIPKTAEELIILVKKAKDDITYHDLLEIDEAKEILRENNYSAE